MRPRPQLTRRSLLSSRVAVESVEAAGPHCCVAGSLSHAGAECRPPPPPHPFLASPRPSPRFCVPGPLAPSCTFAGRGPKRSPDPPSVLPLGSPVLKHEARPT